MSYNCLKCGTLVHGPSCPSCNITDATNRVANLLEQQQRAQNAPRVIYQTVEVPVNPNGEIDPRFLEANKQGNRATAIAIMGVSVILMINTPLLLAPIWGVWFLVGAAGFYYLG